MFPEFSKCLRWSVKVEVNRCFFEIYKSKGKHVVVIFDSNELAAIIRRELVLLGYLTKINLVLDYAWQAYSASHQTSKGELFAKVVVNILQGSEMASAQKIDLNCSWVWCSYNPWFTFSVHWVFFNVYSKLQILSVLYLSLILFFL